MVSDLTTQNAGILGDALHPFPCNRTTYDIAVQSEASLPQLYRCLPVCTQCCCEAHSVPSDASTMHLKTRHVIVLKGLAKPEGLLNLSGCGGAI